MNSAGQARCRAGRTGVVVAVAVVVAVLGCATSVRGQEGGDLETLRRELAARQAVIEQQREQLSRLQAELERQAGELAALAARLDQAPVAVAAATEAPKGQAGPAAQTPAPADVRDAVGDLNAASVAAGAFPGSIRIPGTHDISLAIGGFVKAVAIVDSDLERTGPVFLPANIGAGSPDTEGGTSLDASLSRLEIDAQAPTPSGSVRGYFEWDLNSDNDGSLGFNLRHAYGAWRTGAGTLTAGHTWSTAMDLKILPEGLTEPTVSGAIFQRQSQARWSQPLSRAFKLEVALEDSSSSDATIPEPWRATTRLPDLVGAAEWDWGAPGHVRVIGLLRQIKVTNDQGDSETATAWGLSSGAHLGIGRADKLCVSASFGEGTGRYLLGVPGGQAGFLDVDSGELRLQRGAGALVTYRHAWTESLRSTAGLGRAWVTDEVWQAPDAFDSTSFGLVNLMWSPLHDVTLGAEYQYGVRETRDGSDLDNNRFILGI